MNHYIFIVNDQKVKNKTISAAEIFNLRMDQKRWGRVKDDIINKTKK